MTQENTQQENALLIEKEKNVSKQIQTILEENNMGLKPFIEYLDNAIVARVKLVEIPAKEQTEA